MEGSSRELGKVQELVYELRIEQVMSRDVVTVSPDCTMWELKELLRVKRVSGVPVVSNGELVGVISLERLIQALEKGELSATVGEKMTTQVQVLKASETIISALSLFTRSGFGRLPIVDAAGKLVGILTKGDIVRGLLRHLEAQWTTEEAKRYRGRTIFDGIESNETVLTLKYAVGARDFVRGGEASSKLKRALEQIGAHPQILRRVSIATYEAETNVMIHSVGGHIIATVTPEQIRISAIDTGPGIADVEQAMQAGYSTAPNWVRELGFGAGMGLCNIKACADEMNLTSELGQGTHLEIIFHIN